MKLTESQKRVILKLKEHGPGKVSYKGLKERNLGIVIKSLGEKGLIKFTEDKEKVDGVWTTVFWITEMKLPEVNEEIKAQDYEAKRKSPNEYYRDMREKLKEDPEGFAEYRKKKNEYRKKYRKEHPEKMKAARKRQYERIKGNPELYEKEREKWKEKRKRQLARNPKPKVPKENIPKVRITSPKEKQYMPKVKTEKGLTKTFPKLKEKHLGNLGLEAGLLGPKASAICGNGGKVSAIEIEHGLIEMLGVIKAKYGEESLFSDYRTLSRYLFGEVIKSE
jgi:AAA15 family ATPase/GTPase